ncbi:MAG: ChbG/HpnK family deacetylase [Desulfovibrio sp.]|nr:ChbG/HpnK family deacetylase [Desulfovibrio sp.]
MMPLTDDLHRASVRRMHPEPSGRTLRRLVINADDFGHFHCVSNGIIDCVHAGAVTATGVMACGPAFAAMVPALKELPDLDTGVHLTLTYGAPLSPALGRLYPHGFPGKGRLVQDLLRRRLPVAAVEEEWTEQLQRCLEAGLRPLFLNGHEHVHLLPPLWRVTLALAARYGIPLVREPGPGPGKARVLRWMHLPNRLRRITPAHPSPAMLGGGCSGRMTLAALEQALRRLPPGATAEWMCHPGRDDPAELRDPRLRAFHDWDGERAALCDPALPALLARHGVQLVRFRDLL